MSLRRGKIEMSEKPRESLARMPGVESLVPIRSLGVLQPHQRSAELRRRPLLGDFTPRVEPPKIATRGSGISCRHYVRLRDATVWAILLRDGRPYLAIGPLAPGATHSPPMNEIYASGIDVSGWDLGEFAPASDRQWRCVGARAPQGELDR